MRAARVGPPLALALTTLALALAAGVAGCGTSTQRAPDLRHLPLATGARVTLQVKRCDPGASAYCSWELVLDGPGYASSEALLEREHRLLLARGWSGGNGDTGEQHAADSPGHRLRLTYATAEGDLRGIDLGWIRRSRPVTLALSRAIFAHAPTLSLLLEVGSS